MWVDYADYINSDAWKRRKQTFLKRSQRVIAMRRKFGCIVCEFCKKRGRFNIHHKTYERLGHERSTDLIILCDDCHKAVHSCGAPTLKSATRRIRKLAQPHI